MAERAGAPASQLKFTQLIEKQTLAVVSRKEKSKIAILESTYLTLEQ